MKDNRLLNALGLYASAEGDAAAVVGRGAEKWRRHNALPASAPRRGCERRYLIFPSLGNPRWILPSSRTLILNAGKLVKPSRPLSRLVWGSFRAMTTMRLPVHRLLPQVTVHGVPESAFRLFLAQQVGRADVDFILYTGAKGLYQKYTAQVMTPDGGIVCFAKLAATQEGKEKLVRERNNLERVAALSLKSLRAPEVVAAQDFQGFTVLFISTAPAQLEPHFAELTEFHVSSLVETFRSSLTGQLSGADCREQRRALMRQDAPEKEVREALERALAKFPADATVPLGLSHGDYTPWNILSGGDQIFVYDWELADYRPPYWDVFNYILHFHGNACHRSVEEIMERLLGGHDSGVERYRELLGETGSVGVRECLLLYLVDIALYYDSYIREHRRHGDVISEEARRMLDFALAMLGTL